MGIRNKMVLTERLRKVEEDVKRHDKALEDEDSSLRKILSQQDRIISILEYLTKDDSSYHEWLKQQDKKKEGAKK